MFLAARAALTPSQAHSQWPVVGWAERSLAGFLLGLVALFGAFALLAPSAADARVVLELESSKQPVRLYDWGDYWLEANPADAAHTPPKNFSKVDVDRILADPAAQWKPTPLDGAYPTQRGKTLWIRLTLPAADDRERWYLELPMSSLDHVAVYTREASDGWLLAEAGDHVPVSKWPVPARYALMPLQVSAEGPTQYVVAIRSNTSFSAPLQLVTESGFNQREQRVSLLLGMLFGLGLLVAVYSALSAIVLRHWGYGWYALYAFMATAAQAALSGIAGFMLWPKWPHWADVAPATLSLLAMAPLLLAVAYVAGFRHRAPLWGWLAAVCAGAIAALAGVVALVLPASDLRDVALPGAALVAMLVLLSLLVRSQRFGVRACRWLLVAVLPVLLAALLPISRELGWVPYSFWTQHGVQLALVWELPFSLLALAIHSQERRAVHQRMSELRRVDGTTGLLTQRAFADRLQRAARYAQRANHQVGVLRMEVAQWGELRRTHGPVVLDEVLLRLAARFVSVVRDIDAVSHFGDGVFHALVEDPVDDKKVAQLAHQLLARALAPFEQLPRGLQLRLKVHVVMLPSRYSSSDGVIAQLETMARRTLPGETRAIFLIDGQESIRPI